MENRVSDFSELNDRIASLEARITRLESLMSVETSEKVVINSENYKNSDNNLVTVEAEDEEKGFESQIGRIGLAWLGSVVLLFAVIFFTEYLGNFENKYFSFILDYSSIGIVFISSYYLKKSSPTLPEMFKVVGNILLFYVTLRLHFFSSDPFLDSKSFAIILLLLIVALQVYLAIKRGSQVYATLSLIYLLTIAILDNSTHLSLSLVTLTAFAALFYFFRYEWKWIYSVTVFLSYLVYFLWLFSNPFIGNNFQIIPNHHYGYIYLFVIGGIYCTLPIFRKKDETIDTFVTTGVIVNGLLFTIILVLVTIRFFSQSYVNLFALISLSCLAYSVFLKRITNWNFASAFFALYGFIAMSISLYGMVGLSHVYLLLAVQSLVVVSMALWFRNRLMIVMNSLLFLTILLAYLFLSKSYDAANFSFALVPLISARVINWQRERINMQTEYIRNLYLIEGFFMLLYALFHAVPGNFVSLSWTGAALIHFLLSFLLKNIKYRYMALGTMLSAAVYLFVVDLARIEIIYRILALLFLAVVSIGISIYYTNRSKRTSK